MCEAKTKTKTSRGNRTMATTTMKGRPDFGPENLGMTIDDGVLTIKVDLHRQLGATSTGKSFAIATTSGNRSIAGGIKVGLNVYKPIPKVVETD